MKNIRQGYNIRAYTKKIIELYDRISERLPVSEQADFYIEREKRNLLYAEVARIDDIIEFDNIARPLYEKCFKNITRKRIVDFNQGIDARLVTEEKIKKLAEINNSPLRIAFDNTQ